VCAGRRRSGGVWWLGERDSRACALLSARRQPTCRLSRPLFRPRLSLSLSLLSQSAAVAVLSRRASAAQSARSAARWCGIVIRLVQAGGKRPGHCTHTHTHTQADASFDGSDLSPLQLSRWPYAVRVCVCAHPPQNGTGLDDDSGESVRAARISRQLPCTRLLTAAAELAAMLCCDRSRMTTQSRRRLRIAPSQGRGCRSHSR
jgi:hypothetical protein